MNDYKEVLTSKELSRFWYCKTDNTRLRPKTERTAQNPIFKIIRDKLDLSISNAIAIRKIPSEAVESAKEVANFMFSHSDTFEIELMGTECPTCKRRYASPKLNKVEDLSGINIGRALYDNQQALATKNYGRFRFVNKFGLGRNEEGQSSSRGGLRGLFLLGWFIGFFYIFAVIFLYYFLGLEVKIGNRFYPLGIFLVIVLLLGILFFLASNNLLKPIYDLITSFGRG